MTLPVQIGYSGPYMADSIQTTFAYTFRIKVAAHLEVLQSDLVSGFEDIVPNSAYSVTGIGAANGGSIIFFVPPQSGLVIYARSNDPFSQDTDYQTGTPLLADTIEDSEDRHTTHDHQLLERLSRCPSFPATSLAALRNLIIPRPQPLGLWQWNATSDGITYAQPAIVQVTPSVLSPLAFAKAVPIVADVSAFAGTPFITIESVFPAGCIRVGVLIRLTTAFGVSQGLTTFSMGSTDVGDRWGFGIINAVTAAPVGANNPGMWRNFEPKPLASAEDVILAADAGLFDTVGAFKLTALYYTMVAE